jgi:hypothetical protein
LNLGSVPRAVAFHSFAALFFGEGAMARIDAKPLSVASIALALIFLGALGFALRVLTVSTALPLISAFIMSFAATFVSHGGDLSPQRIAARYYIFPSVAIVLTLAAACSRLIDRRGIVPCGVAAAFLFMPLAGIIRDGTLPPYPTTHWPEAASCIASHTRCHVDVNPSEWSFDLPPVSTARR